MWLVKILLVVLLVSGCGTVPEVEPYAGVLEALENTVVVTDGMGHGSGIILQDGYVLTAAHCIHNGMIVREPNGTEYPVEEVYVNEDYDVAVMSVPGITGSCVLAGELELITHVWLIGAPLDPALQGTITEGYLVHLDRDVFDWEDAVQISAISAPGNSGGPVVDDDGRVIGLLVGGPAHIDPYSICEPVDHILDTLEDSGWF
jgi:S1-C subfamily serine protease